MFVIRAGTHKMLVRKASRENPDQTALCLGLFQQATSVQNFRTLTISKCFMNHLKDLTVFSSYLHRIKY